MKRARLYRAMASGLGILACACGFGCMAGGTDDVENPSLQVSATDAAGKPYGSAVLNAYARYQNPFTDSLPILSVAADGKPAPIPDTAVISAFARAHERGTPTPAADTLEFNLVAAAPGGEAFLGGFALIKRPTGWGFVRKTGGIIAYPDGRGVLPAEARLTAPIAGQHGNVGAKGMELGLKRVFVPGSPYAAQLASDGSFALAHIAAGRYELKAVSADDKIYTAADSLTAGSDFSASDWAEADVIWVVPGGP